MNLLKLLKYGYFPKELPPPFTSYPFGEFVEGSNPFQNIRNNLVTKPCLHNLARPGNLRRALSIQAPFNYLKLCRLLDANRETIEAVLAKSRISVSKPQIDESDSRAFVPATEGKELPKSRAKSRAGSRYILRADISRFYYSIYTHSIPWAIMGKAAAKANTTTGFANDLDKIMRNAQDRQTFGIPVGPDTSFIVSEIIACAIDEEIQRKGLKGFRYVDDYEFSFLSRSEAEKAIPILESILQDFELALNPTKTGVEDLPLSIEQPWRLKIRQWKLDGATLSNETLLGYFDMLFDLYRQNRSEPVLRYGIACLRSSQFADKELLLDLLLQCIPIEPGTLKEALFLLQRLNIGIQKKKLRPIINHLISFHGPMKHGSEVAWALWAAIHHEINISARIMSSLKGFNDSIVGLLALHAIEKGLIPTASREIWAPLMTATSLTDGNWLIAYEADLKGWLPSIDENNHVEADEYFRQLKQNDISFYDDGIEYFVDETDNSDGYDSIDSADEDETNDDDDNDDDEQRSDADSNDDDLPF